MSTKCLDCRYIRGGLVVRFRSNHLISTDRHLCLSCVFKNFKFHFICIYIKHNAVPIQENKGNKKTLNSWSLKHHYWHKYRTKSVVSTNLI